MTLPDSRAPSGRPAAREVVWIRSGDPSTLPNLRELRRFRYLLWILALRDLRVRYRQTIVGVAWALVQPAAMMLVFGGLFSLIGRVPTSSSMPYALTSLCGLLPWQLFAFHVEQSSQSLVSQRALITKIYFPRVLIPISPLLTGLVDFVVGTIFLVLLMAYWHVWPGLRLLALPCFIVPMVAISTGLGLWLAALTALYRDIRFVVPFFLQLGFLASPVVYDASVIVPGHFAAFYNLNPMATVLAGVRWALLGTPPPSWIATALTLLASAVVLVGGAKQFHRLERSIADRV